MPFASNYMNVLCEKMRFTFLLDALYALDLSNLNSSFQFE